jgi:hypothetical protein
MLVVALRSPRAANTNKNYNRQCVKIARKQADCQPQLQR